MPESISPDAHLIIIGAMKSGTSSLFKYLQSHPQICAANVKEPEYFSRDQSHETAVDRYDDLWAFDARCHRWALEASTGYTKYPQEPDVPGVMHAYGVRPRFIYLLRNPFERIESQYNFLRKQHPRWLFEMTSDSVVNPSDYELQLSRYRPYFPVRDFLLLDFDLLALEPRRALERVYDFLDLPATHFPRRFTVENPTADKPSKWWTRMRVRRGRDCRELTPQNRMQRLDKAQHAEILCRLQPGMQRLHAQFGFDVARWGFDVERQ